MFLSHLGVSLPLPPSLSYSLKINNLKKIRYHLTLMEIATIKQQVLVVHGEVETLVHSCKMVQLVHSDEHNLIY